MRGHKNDADSYDEQHSGGPQTKVRAGKNRLAGAITPPVETNEDVPAVVELWDGGPVVMVTR
jgi:hypothetical protein